MSDHLHRLQTVYDDRFAREYGPWRHVVSQVADRFLSRVLMHIADKGRVTTRYYGWYANRSCGMRALARLTIAPYSRRIVDPLRLTFLSHATAYARGTGHQPRRARVGPPKVAEIRDAR